MRKSGGGVELTKSGKTVNLHVWGTIDEKVALRKTLADLKELLAPGDSVAIDMGEIYRMNSVGIRGWIEFIGGVESLTRFEFLCLGEVIILQAANIPSVLGKTGAPVREFEAPYRCVSCKVRESHQLPTKAARAEDGTFRAPTLQCPRCKNNLEFDGYEEEYFSFLRRSSAPGERRPS